MPQIDPQSPPDVPPGIPPLGAAPSQQHPLPVPPAAQMIGQSQQLPQLPSLNFDSSSQAQSQSRPVDSTVGRALTPITELNSARETLTDLARAPGPSLSTEQFHGSQQHASESDEDESLAKFVATSVILESEEGGFVLGRPTASSSPPTSGTSRKLSGDSFGRGAGSRPDSKLSPSTENTTTRSHETFGSGMGVAEVMGVKLPFSPLTSPESPSFSTNSSMSVRSPTPGNQGPTLQSPASPGSPGRSLRSLPSSPSYSILTSPHSLLEKDLPSIQALQAAQSFSSPPSRSLMRSPSNAVPPVPDKHMSPSQQSMSSTPVSKLTPAPPPGDPQSVFTDALFFMQQLDEKSAPPRRVPTTISEKSDSTSASEPSLPTHTPPSQPARSGVVSEASLSGSRIALGRKPSGARALTTSGVSRGLNPDASSISSPEQQHLHRIPDSDTDTMSDHGEPETAPALKKAQLDDVNADALAALSFLDVDTATAPAPPKQPTASTSAGDAVRPPPPRPQLSPQPTESLSTVGSSDNVGQYKSTFAPSNQAVQRKARLQAQQAAHQAAVHRPGRANGKRGPNSRVSGWNETSDEDDEEEEEEEEEDGDSDSEDEPSTTGSKRPSQVSVHAPSPAHAPIGGTPIRPLRPQSRTQSPVEVATATEANPYAQLRHPRGLPPVPRPQTQGDFSCYSVILS
jgi:CCR4-NOT transcriptional complex subunit CAF120